MVKSTPKEPLTEMAPASGAQSVPNLEDRVGIERAFDVIRHYTVHTKGYVVTALKLIYEFGNAADKALLAELMREHTAGTPGQPPEAAAKKKISRKK